MPSKCFASWASPNWTRPPRRRDKNRSCSDQPQNPPPSLLRVTGHNVKHALGHLHVPAQPIPFEPRLQEYCRWAKEERGLSEATVKQFSSQIGHFLRWYGTLGRDLADVRVGDVD